MKKLSIFVLAMGMTMLSFGQSKTVKNFEEKAEGYKLFLYQSVIRVMNKDKNPEFNMLIRDLEHLRFVSSESGSNAKETFMGLDKGVRGEGFQEIMSFDNSQYRCRVYEKESSGNSTWVATMLMDDVAGVLEMEGSLDIKYLNALSSLDMEQVEDYLELDERGNKKRKKKVEKKEEGNQQ